MIRKNAKFMWGIGLGLTVVATIAIIVAVVIGYVKKGEINFILIALAAVVLTANLLAIKTGRAKSANEITTSKK